MRRVATWDQAQNDTTMAAVNAMPASKPNAATPRAKRNARIRCSPSSCTSVLKSSSLFSPMVNSRNAKFLERAASWLEAFRGFIHSESIPIAIAPAGDEKAEERSDTNPNGDGLIGMLMHGFVRCFGAGDRSVADATGDFLGAFQGGGETFAGFPDFFSRHIAVAVIKALASSARDPKSLAVSLYVYS